jgi:two-component system cell cycle sensor histidine kinase/response regulator CckA
MPKDETVELLAGGIAQDFDALLSAIVGHADNLSDYISPADPRAAEVAGIREAAESAVALTRQLLAFSRTQDLRLTTVDLNAVVQRSRHTLRRLLGDFVTLDTYLGDDLRGVRADGDQLEIVLRNLAVNAREAMPHGGAFTITTTNARLSSKQAGRCDVEPGEYVELSLSDTGVGMEPAVQAQLFEPFFTTKQRARGTGLGLAMVYGVVRQSGGCINVESAVGRGSRFVIYLPATDQPAAAEHGARADSGSETVLVMGDDASVQSFVGDVLRRRGYDVLVADDPWHALRLADAHERPIDLLITAGTAGAIVTDALSARRPSMRVLYVSASEVDAPVATGPNECPVDILHKPFSPAALARKVRALLQP